MMKRSPLRSKRETPRVKRPERVAHERMTEKRVRPSPEQRRYWASLPPFCVACGAPDAIIHHILANAPGKIGRRDHWLAVRICAACHATGTKSVHMLGSEAAFLREHGVDLVDIAVKNRDRWRGPNAHSQAD